MKQNKSFKRFTLISVIAIYMIASTAMGDVYVREYDRKDGTYVQSHWRSDPDGDLSNNWSTYPNINPYTGKIGTKRYPGYSHVESLYEPKEIYNGDDNIVNFLSSMLNIIFLCVLLFLFFGKDPNISKEPNIKA